VAAEGKDRFGRPSLRRFDIIAESIKQHSHYARRAECARIRPAACSARGIRVRCPLKLNSTRFGRIRQAERTADSPYPYLNLRIGRVSEANTRQIGLRSAVRIRRGSALCPPLRSVFIRAECECHLTDRQTDRQTDMRGAHTQRRTAAYAIAERRSA